jgi:hypothetical protein
LASPAIGEEVELCKVGEYIDQMLGQDGPLKGCQPRDAVHFQINQKIISPASVVARYCNLNATVFTETNSSGSPLHVVCSYLWKPSKSVKRVIPQDDR